MNQYNSSTHFVYPLFNLDVSYDRWLYNTYITHEDEALGGKPEEDEYYLYLVFKFSGRTGDLFTDSYLQLEDRLQDHPQYYFHYDISGGQYVLFGLRIPKDYLFDYKCYLEGKYSKIRRNTSEYPNRNIPAYSLICSRWNSPSIKAIMDKSEQFRIEYERALQEKYDTDITIPENAEVYTSYQDLHLKEREHFRENKLPIKVL